MTEQKNEQLTPAQASNYLGVTRRTLERYVASGRLPKHEQLAPRRVFFLKSELDALKEEHPVMRYRIMRLPVMVEHYDKYLEAMGLKPISEFLEVPNLAPLPEEIANLMGLPEGTPAPHRVLRQGVIQGKKPIFTRISDNYYNPTLVTAVMLVEMQKDPRFDTMKTLEEQGGKVVVRSHLDAIARLSNERERKYLKVSSNEPILQIIGTNYAEDGIVIFVNQRFFIGDLSELSFDFPVPYWKTK